jgi:hypothetical protein
MRRLQATFARLTPQRVLNLCAVQNINNFSRGHFEDIIEMAEFPSVLLLDIAGWAHEAAFRALMCVHCFRNAAGPG